MPLLKIDAAQPDLLQVGRPDHAYWIADGVWGAKGMTRGIFTTTSGVPASGLARGRQGPADLRHLAAEHAQAVSRIQQLRGKSRTRS
jgi:hypothetical protein